MKPAEKTRVWRKNGRDVVKGVPQGRRPSHQPRRNTRIPAYEFNASVTAEETTTS